MKQSFNLSRNLGNDPEKTKTWFKRMSPNQQSIIISMFESVLLEKLEENLSFQKKAALTDAALDELSVELLKKLLQILKRECTDANRGLIEDLEREFEWCLRK